MEPTRHRPATPSCPERQQVQRDLEGIPLENFPHWGKTLGYARNQVHFLLLPEFCEQGLLTPTQEGYTYRIEERFECPNIYCNRYTDAMQTRSPSTGHAEAEASPYGISNQDDCTPEPGGNPTQLGEIAPYTMANPHHLQQPDFYNPMSSGLEYLAIEGQTYQFTAQQSMDMDTTSNWIDLRSPPNPAWNSDIYDPALWASLD
ncbi:hypothetical protein JOM56_001498 [Amanita muscaria]